MSPFNQNPGDLVRIFVMYIKAIVQFLIWATIGLVSIAAAYVAARAVWVAVKTILQALGI